MWTEFDLTRFSEYYAGLWKPLTPERLEGFARELGDRSVDIAIEGLQRVFREADKAMSPSPKQVVVACRTKEQTKGDGCKYCYGDPLFVRVWVVLETEQLTVQLDGRSVIQTEAGPYFVRPDVAKEIKAPGERHRWPLRLWLLCDACREWINVTKRSCARFMSSYQEFCEPENVKTARLIKQVVGNQVIPAPVVDWPRLVEEWRQGAADLDGRALDFLAPVLGVER